MQLFRKIFPPKYKPSHDEIQRHLMEILDFKKDDLKENHYGRMSRHQHYWLVDRWLRKLFLNIGGAVLLGGVGYYFTTHPVGNSPNLVWTLLLIITIIGTLVAGIMSFSNMLVDIVNRKIGVASGPGQLEVYHANRHIVYRLYVEDEQADEAIRFDVPRKLYDALVDNQNYTVYYAKRSKVILAIEVD